MTPAESRLREAVENGYPHHTLTLADARAVLAEIDRLTAENERMRAVLSAIRSYADDTVSTNSRDIDDWRRDVFHLRSVAGAALAQAKDMSTYENLDALLVARIDTLLGATFLEMQSHGPIAIEAGMLGKKLKREDFRVIDGRLQALRKRGVIRFDRPVWRLNGIDTGDHVHHKPTGEN
jgi:hypothetical protein